MPIWKTIPLILLLSLTSRAESNTETYKDIIEKAQSLSLQKERAHAVQLLSSSIERESKKAPPPKELVQTLDEVSSLFLSDKAQQLYELAISLRMSDPAMSLAKQNDAAKIEPDNLQIQLEQFRLNLMLGNCNEGAGIADRILTQAPALESVKLASAQAALCRNRLDEALRFRGLIDVKKSPLAIYWNAVEAEAQIRLGGFPKAGEILSSNEKLDKNFPETQYLRWRWARESNKSSDLAAEKYISSCKSMSPRAARSYIHEAFLCRRVVEVETSLKKNNNAQP